MKVFWTIVFILCWPITTSAQFSTYNWQSVPMQSGEVANIVVSPTNPDVMYLGIEVNAHSAYKSEDRGKTWKRILTYDHAKDVAVHPTNPDIAFLADSQQVWRTTTGGKGTPRVYEGGRSGDGTLPSFSLVLKNNNDPGPAETSFSSVVFAPSNPDIWYASTRGSSDNRGGDNKKPHLWKSTNTGKDWSEIAGNYPPLLVLAVDPTNDQRLVIGSDEGIYESTNGGKTVTQIFKADHVAGLTTLDGQTWLAASLEGVLRSTNNGKNWSKITDNLPDKQILRVAIVRDQPNTAWASSYNGVARSMDAGATWQDVSGNLPAKNLQALVVDPTNPNLAIVATETFTFSVRSESRLFQQGQYYKQGIYRTEKGGATWSRSDSGIFEENLIDITTHPKRPTEVWASQQSSRGLYRSRDAGQSWALSPHLLTHYPMRLAFFTNAEDKLAHTSLHIGEDFGISTDSGKSWATQSEKTFFDAFNRGKSLFDQNKSRGGNLHLHGIAINPKNPDIIYVGSVDDPSSFNQKPVTGAHIFKSVNGGKTWQESDAGYDHEYATSINDIKIDPTNPDTLYIAMTKKESTNGNGVWKSVDAGANWKRTNNGMPDDASVSTLIIHPQKSNQIIAATYEGIYRTTDGGSNWTRTKSGQFRDIEFDPTNPEIVYTGSGIEFSTRDPNGPKAGEEGIFVSSDFGQTWKNINNNLPSGKITTVGVNATGKIIYVGVEGHGLYMASEPTLGTVPADTTTVTELGGNPREGPRAKRGEYGNDHSDSRDHSASRGPFGQRGQEPPAIVKLIMILIGLTIIGAIAWFVTRIIRNKKSPQS